VGREFVANYIRFKQLRQKTEKFMRMNSVAGGNEFVWLLLMNGLILPSRSELVQVPAERILRTGVGADALRAKSSNHYLERRKLSSSFQVAWQFT
jgi:hypothetical protein